jgi:hypothetical protein
VRQDPGEHLEPHVAPRRHRVLAALLARLVVGHSPVLARARERAVEHASTPMREPGKRSPRAAVRALGILAQRELDAARAAGKRSSSAVRSHLSLITSSRPPIAFAEPCRMRAVVTPPASARRSRCRRRRSTSAIVHLGADRDRALVDVAVDRDVRVAVDDARREMLAARRRSRTSGRRLDRADAAISPSLTSTSPRRRARRAVDRHVADQARSRRCAARLAIELELAGCSPHAGREPAGEQPPSARKRPRARHQAPSRLGLRVAVNLLVFSPPDHFHGHEPFQDRARARRRRHVGLEVRDLDAAREADLLARDRPVQVPSTSASSRDLAAQRALTAPACDIVSSPERAWSSARSKSKVHAPARVDALVGLALSSLESRSNS